jgi:hypothetical protein
MPIRTISLEEIISKLSSLHNNLATHSPDRADIQLSLQRLEGLISKTHELELLERSEPKDEKNIEILANYVISKISQLSMALLSQQLASTALKTDLICLWLTIWANRRGTKIKPLSVVVNAIAQLANRLKTETELIQLHELIIEIETSAISQNESKPDEATQLLLLNSAIVATRTLEPKRMELAFDRIARLLPNDAADFFAQAMQQLDIIGYPPPVRQVVEAYYKKYTNAHTLH